MKAPKAVVVYLDASAVLRLLYGGAKGGAPIDGVVATSSAIVEVETHRSIQRARLTGKLDDLELARKRRELDELLAGVHLFPVADEVLAVAKGPSPIAVNALHAVHVATADIVRTEAGGLEFWTHDSQQAAAALAAGLDVRGVDLG